MNNIKPNPSVFSNCGTSNGYAKHYRRKENACLPCRKAMNFYQSNRKRIKKPENPNAHVKWRYQISVEKYQEMLANQNYVCAICKQKETTVIKGQTISLAVDHDHSCCPGRKSCGKCVRGLLCKSCNLLIARIENNMLFAEITNYLTN